MSYATPNSAYWPATQTAHSRNDHLLCTAVNRTSDLNGEQKTLESRLYSLQYRAGTVADSGNPPSPQQEVRSVACVTA